MLCPKLLVAVAFLAPVFAQTHTDCNPMNQTCPPDAAFGTSHTFVFNTSRTVTDTFNTTAGALSYGSDGAEFTVAKRGDSPTIQSNFHIFWGQVSVILKAAPGQGIVSSVVLQSDDLDEIDWEWIGGNGTYVQTNYFGKGNTTSYDRAVWHEVSSDVRDNFHNYTTFWTQEKIDFYIDGTKVRTLPYAAANGGSNYPQTPMDVRMGIWAGGDPANDKYTIQWAGGATDFTKAPYTMNVKEAYVQDFSNGTEYEWTDRSGSFQSIKAIAQVNLASLLTAN
jgi:beta-glucanase (GH16 family)